MASADQAATTVTPTGSEGTAAPVAKQFVTSQDGRRFLVETIRLADIPALISLPDCGTGTGGGTGAIVRPSTNVYASIPMPPTRLHAAAQPHPRLLARATPRTGPAVRIDYRATLTGSTTLQADTTYLVSGGVGGAQTAEGGTVLKFKGGASLYTYGLFTCKNASGSRPIIFTCVDDDTVGESMQGYPNSGWTGSINPSGYASPVLNCDIYGGTLNNCVFRYAQTAIQCSSSSGSSALTLNDVQMLKCSRGVQLVSGSGTGGTLTLSMNNGLLCQVQYPFGDPSLLFNYNANLANCTIDRSQMFLYGGGYFYLRATNSIFANVTNSSAGTYSGAYNGFYRSAQLFGSPQLTVSDYPFLSVGAGNYYLTDSSGWRNAGTNGCISAALLADLQKRTTYPPVVIAGTTLNTALNLSPQAQRDTDAIDLGWHYSPADYALGWVLVTNAAVTVNPGTVIAAFGTNSGTYGLAIGQNASLQCQGTPNNQNWIVQYNTVQEQPITNWFQTSGGSLCSEFQGLTPASSIKCRFTGWSVLSQAVPHFNAPTNTGPLLFQDCEFHGGKITSAGPTLVFTNCLFERVYTEVQPKDAKTNYFRNNLVYGGTFNFGPTNSLIQDNLFDKPSITNWIGGWGNSYAGGFNAYVSGSSRLQPTNATDIILTGSPTYRAGPLGAFYLLSPNTKLIDADTNVAAGQVGLFHYTVFTNIANGVQIKETNSWVDVSYHYVATDALGNPIDSDSDGLPDYLENTCGSGTYNSSIDISNWQAADTDGDGVNDYLEYIQGRNPKVSGSTGDSSGVVNLQIYTPLK